MFPKLAAVVVGAGAIGIGGVAFAKPEWLGINRETPWTPLSQDEGFKDSDEGVYSGKFGSTYKDYLVGVVGTKKGEKLNKRMWEKLLERLENDDKTNGKFKRKGGGALAVTAAYDDDTATALNKVCDTAYKTEENSFGTNDSTFNKVDVWKYCSPGKLTTTSEDEETDRYEETKIGGESTNKTKMISVKNSANDWFWKIRNEDFWKGSGTWSGSGAAEASGNEKSIFKEAYTSQKDNESSRTTIKKLCEEAYRKPNSSSPNLTDAKKFCQLEKTS